MIVCQGRAKSGRRCRRAAGADGFCSTHGPAAQDMAALGRKGGTRSGETRRGEKGYVNPRAAVTALLPTRELEAAFSLARTDVGRDRIRQAVGDLKKIDELHTSARRLAQQVSVYGDASPSRLKEQVRAAELHLGEAAELLYRVLLRVT